MYGRAAFLFLTQNFMQILSNFAGNAGFAANINTVRQSAKGKDMAGRLSDAWLDELRSRVPIEEVVGEYVPLKQKGKRFWGCCPFHNEKTPSFSVDTESQLYYCFGCHKGGTVIHFVMEMERMEFMDAVKTLAERVHMPLPASTESAAENDSNRQKRERILDANVTAARFFHALLWTDEGAEALNYLYKRGLNDSDIKHFGLGASPHSRDGLYRELQRQGFDDETLLSAGLIGRKENRTYDMFRNRVIFPIINAQGRVLGFGGRAMGDVQPKYLNTSDTPVFNKRQGLYAINFAKKERNLGRLVLVEGYMDTVSLRKHGVQGVVATLGTALTEEQARLIRRYAPEVWISYDGDKAGQKAALRALDIFEEQNIPAKVIDYPAGMDPDDFIRSKGVEGFQALRKLDPFEYRLLRAKDEYDLSTQEGRTQYALQGCNILKKVKNPVELENHIARLMHDTGFEREVLFRQIGIDALSAPQDPQKPTLAPRRKAYQRRAAVPDYEKAEHQLLSMLVRDMIPSEIVHPEDFTVPLNRTIFEMLQNNVSINQLVDAFSDEERNQAMTALHYTPLAETREDALNDAESCLACIRKHRLNEEINRLTEQLATVRPEDKRALNERIQRLLMQL